jgi:UDP-N-acetylglucosamine 2-epimerase (non-hydrolysing)
LKIVHIVGARPNFMKAAPVLIALRNHPQIEQLLVHTGQHYDERMSDIFFRQLGMPQPDINLDVGSGSHAVQTAEIMVRFERVLLTQKPDWLMVYGDVNSTIACALVAAKLGVKIAHVEAGLRSWDRSMPEEINRVLTDQISDLFFTPSTDADENLKREGIAPEKIHFVGNCMIDTLVRLLEQARKPLIDGLEGRFVLVTLHRPSNVDAPEELQRIVRTLSELGGEIPVVFPIHPRTRQRLAGLACASPGSGLHLIEPQGYLEFLWLQQHATMILTDSGGIQEEATFLKVPCLTIRENTERPITCDLGTNILVGRDMERLKHEARRILGGEKKEGTLPLYWEGKAGERVARVMAAMADARGRLS